MSGGSLKTPRAEQRRRWNLGTLGLSEWRVFGSLSLFRAAWPSQPAETWDHGRLYFFEAPRPGYDFQSFYRLCSTLVDVSAAITPVASCWGSRFTEGASIRHARSNGGDEALELLVWVNDRVFGLLRLFRAAWPSQPVETWDHGRLYVFEAQRPGYDFQSFYRLYSTLFFFFFSHTFHFPASGQAVVTGVVPSPPRFLPSIFIAHRVQQSHCSSIFHQMLLTHALALSASQFVHKKKSQRIYTSMHSAGLELTKLTSIRLEDNLIRHRGDRILH